VNRHPLRPMLRWAGSKRRQLFRLNQFWGPEYSRYVEPFVGSACLFFDLAPGSAILGDINEELILFYETVRSSPEELYSRLCRLPRDPETFQRWRKKAPISLDAKTRALRFLYLNRNCFNGIYRTNSRGGFNVPFGYGSGDYPSREAFMICATRLRKAKLVNGDFGKTMALVKKGDFVYIDPPFAVQSRRVFREYAKKSFSTADIGRLTSRLSWIDQQGAHFLVSYADCAEARQIAADWNALRFRIRRNIAGFADQRRNAFEWLITNVEMPNFNLPPLGRPRA
jgi:DNA adenine methylase